MLLNYIWHAFHFPNDLPYRFSFMYSFILLTMAYKAFRHITGVLRQRDTRRGNSLFFRGIVIIQKVGSKNVDETTVIISLLFVVLYTLIFLSILD